MKRYHFSPERSFYERYNTIKWALSSPSLRWCLIWRRCMLGGQSIPDHRDRRGLQYPLASLLMIGVLAKLAGQVSLRGMAHWAKLRSRELASALPS